MNKPALFGMLIVASFIAVNQKGDPEETQTNPEPIKVIKKRITEKGAVQKSKSDPTTPPSLDLPFINLWKPDFNNWQLCQPTTGKCKAMPNDNFYCTREMDFDAQIYAGRVIIAAGKKCKKWGKDPLLSFKSPGVPRSRELEEAAEHQKQYYLNQIHISWLNGNSPQYAVTPTSDLLCFSKADREKQFDFFGFILRRCLEWGK